MLDFDKSLEYRTSSNNAALEVGFNNVEIDGRRLSTEDWLAQLEGKASPVIRLLVEDPESVTKLTSEQEDAIGRFLAALRLRTPAFREWFGPQSASMLEEVSGWSNILWGMSWRCGRAPGSMRLYTSDNPMAAFLPSVRPWWDHGAFATLTYYVPLSPDVLLQIKPWAKLEESQDDAEPRRGARRRCDYSSWEISFARHAITADASRFLYGEGPLVSKRCAIECLSAIDRFNLDHAMKYQGYDPNPPKMPDFEMYLAQKSEGK